MAHIDPLLQRNKDFAATGAHETAITVSGHVYNVTTGLVNTVVPAAPMHPRTSSPAAEPA
jgi:hypothetical protein